MKLPHRRTTILSVLAFVAAIGGYGGYIVVKDNPGYNPLYDYQTHRVVAVTDGDTIILEDDTRVRLLGIDAPETGSCYGLESGQALSDLVLDKQVRLEKDITATDDFGRFLRYVFLDNPDPRADNILVNMYMVEQGFALDHSVSVDKRYRNALAKARERARDAGRGIWTDCPAFVADLTTTINSPDAEPTDPNCLIKGNLSSQGAGKTYFLPGCGNYGRVKIDPSRGEQYFCTAEEAESAGFTLSNSCLPNKISSTTSPTE